MYYIIHKLLYNTADEVFYLKAYDAKKRNVTYTPHVEEAMKFQTCADTVMFILNAPEIISEDMMTIPAI